LPAEIDLLQLADNLEILIAFDLLLDERFGGGLQIGLTDVAHTDENSVRDHQVIFVLSVSPLRREDQFGLASLERGPVRGDWNGERSGVRLVGVGLRRRSWRADAEFEVGRVLADPSQPALFAQ